MKKFITYIAICLFLILIVFLFDSLFFEKKAARKQAKVILSDIMLCEGETEVFIFYYKNNELIKTFKGTAESAESLYEPLVTNLLRHTQKTSEDKAVNTPEDRIVIKLLSDDFKYLFSIFSANDKFIVRWQNISSGNIADFEVSERGRDSFKELYDWDVIKKARL